MIETEMKTARARIRIHDDYLVASPQQSLPTLSQIVSGSYRRRMREQRLTTRLKTEP